MRKYIYLIIILVLSITLITCKKGDDWVSNGVYNEGNNEQGGCVNTNWPEWQTSGFVLPYPVGKSYTIDLNACSSSYHAPGMPDQYAIDFNMAIGTEITASIGGTVVYVEESGMDYQQPNNAVVVQTGNMFVAYMHLTQNGAAVQLGQAVAQGDLIGYSGATGLAGYPHLHFVVINSITEFPYESFPVTFRNTSPNPTSLISGATYEALPY